MQATRRKPFSKLLDKPQSLINDPWVYGCVAHATIYAEYSNLMCLLSVPFATIIAFEAPNHDSELCETIETTDDHGTLAVTGLNAIESAAIAA